MTNLHTHSQQVSCGGHHANGLRPTATVTDQSASGEVRPLAVKTESTQSLPQEFPLTPFAEAVQQTRNQTTLFDVVDRAIQDAKFPPKCEAEVEVGFKVMYCGLGLYRDSVSGLLMCPDGHVEPNQESE